jgi:hypothetical protein
MPEDSPSATVLLALWNDVDPQHEVDYNEWHAREHVPERLTVPGIGWALRYAHCGGIESPRYLTLYGLRDATVTDSAAYRRLLAEPTPASRRMRPTLRNISRWICTLDVNDGIGRFERLTVRTVDRSARQPTRPEGSALLVATRIPDAAALPWLAGGQARTMQGDRIEGLASNDPEAAVAWPTAGHYQRLGIG